MSNKMICPVCGAGKVLSFPDGTFACDNEYCKSYNETDTTAYNLLIQAKQDLEQSEKCCSAWETQALDYKAETVALSGKLEIARKALESISGVRSNIEDYYGGVFIHYQQMVLHMDEIATNALKQIENKE